MISEDPVKPLNSKIYIFGEFRLEADNLILLRNSEIVSLAPKALEVLVVLARSGGKLITKQELIDTVWANTFVEETNLAHHISALRKALGEDKDERRFIETIPRRGYRFVAEVRNAVSPKDTEIVINERTIVRVVDETTLEENDLPVQPEITKSPQNLVPIPHASSSFNSRRVVLALAAALVLIVGAAAFLGYRSFYAAKAPLAPTEISFVRLTPDEDVNAPSVSPDGASIVYVKKEHGQQSLWRKQIVSGEMTQLTPAISLVDIGIYSTRFSPDGRWIYFSQFLTQEVEKERTIYRIPANGGAAREVLAGLPLGVDFSISPDGRQLAYTFDFRQVIVADIESNNKRVVTDWDGINKVVKSDWNAEPAWSPDGTRLIFPGGITQDNKNIQQLFEVVLATGEVRQIPRSEDFGIRQIEWLADGSTLIVTDAAGQIWRIDYYTGKAKRLSTKTDNYNVLRISADSKTLIAQQSLGQFNIWTAPADNIEKRRQITIGAAAKHGTSGLAQMPDGRILYTSLESGTSDIWIMNPDGSERRQLTVNAGSANYYPQPTADGRYIVYWSNRSGTQQVWRMDADGKNPVQLSQVIECFGFTLAPEGDVYYITFLADQQKYQIYKIPVAGGETVEVNDYYSEDPPQFSPDGKWIYFFGSKTKGEKPRLALIERNTGTIIRYFNTYFAPVGWSPDSKSVIDTQARGQELWRQPIDGSAPEKIYDFSPLKIADWDYSADGKRIVLSLGNSTAEVVLIQNFN